MSKLKTLGGSLTVIAIITAVTSWYASPIPKDAALIVPDLGFDQLLKPAKQQPATTPCSQQNLDAWQLVQAPDAHAQRAALYNAAHGSRMVEAGQDMGQGVVMQAITPTGITLACRGSSIQRIVGFAATSTGTPFNPNGN